MATIGDLIDGSKSIWKKIFPGFDKNRNENSRDIVAVESQGSISASPWSVSPVPEADSVVSVEDEQLGIAIPSDRLSAYAVFATMRQDPTIHSALQLHVEQALSAKAGTSEIVSIESTSDSDDPITEDLRNTFKEIINQNCQEWAYNAAVYGVWYVRPYGKQGRGIEHIRSDYYTHPRFIKEYQHGGQLAGYTHAYQNVARDGQLIVMEPWKIVSFKIPQWHVQGAIEPIRFDQDVFDIADDDLYREEIVESQNYGTSLLDTSYGPWFDLLNAIVSLNMSRRNAARLERIVGVNTGKLSPTKAAEYLNTVARQLKRANEDHANQVLSKGFFQTVINHLLPIFGDKGRLDISTVEGSPNIEGLEDVMFHVKRLSSSLGVDPSLIGFGDMLSGGLGEGGYLRLSLIAAIKSNALRHAIRNGLEELFCIHVAMKHGKYFLPGQRPWRIVFNSVSTAMEREEQENQESRLNYATLTATLAQIVDPEFSKVDWNALNNYLWTDILRVDEEKFKGIFPKLIKPVQPESAEQDAEVSESARIEEIIKKAMDQIYD